jgi:hypothetical protein
MFDSTFGSSEKGIGIGDLLGYKVSDNASGYYVTLDFLENIADKVTSFGNWEYNYHLLFNSKYVTDSVVPLKKIFAYNFPKLTTLASFSIYETSKTVDFSDLFNSKTESITDKASDHITTIYRFI